MRFFCFTLLYLLMAINNAYAQFDEIKAEEIIRINTKLDIVVPILINVVQQLFAYHVAVARGNDVDQPRNLAKSVTVE